MVVNQTRSKRQELSQTDPSSLFFNHNKSTQ
jgi:hypothetical protein